MQPALSPNQSDEGQQHWLVCARQRADCLPPSSAHKPLLTLRPLARPLHRQPVAQATPEPCRLFKCQDEFCFACHSQPRSSVRERKFICKAAQPNLMFQLSTLQSIQKMKGKNGSTLKCDNKGKERDDENYSGTSALLHLHELGHSH